MRRSMFLALTALVYGCECSNSGTEVDAGIVAANEVEEERQTTAEEKNEEKTKDSNDSVGFSATPPTKLKLAGGDALVALLKDEAAGRGIDGSSTECSVINHRQHLLAYRTFKQFVDFVMKSNNQDLGKISEGLEKEIIFLNLEKIEVTLTYEDKDDVVYLGLRELGTSGMGYGYYLIRKDTVDLDFKYAIEIPHPFFDGSSPEISAKIADKVPPAFYFLSGRHRNCSDQTSPEPLPGNYSTSVDFKISDPSHYSFSFFQAAHNAAASQTDLVVQVHGFVQVESIPNTEAILSAGALSTESQYLLDLKTALEARSIETALFPDGTSSFGARSNTQGVVTRTFGSAKFLHFEISRSLRTDPDRYSLIAEAVEDLIP